METRLKVIVEKHSDGYVAYPLGMNGIVVGQGDSYRAALNDVRSAVTFHVDTFGPKTIENAESRVIEAFVAETSVVHSNP